MEGSLSCKWTDFLSWAWSASSIGRTCNASFNISKCDRKNGELFAFLTSAILALDSLLKIIFYFLQFLLSQFMTHTQSQCILYNSVSLTHTHFLIGFSLIFFSFFPYRFTIRLILFHAVREAHQRNESRGRSERKREKVAATPRASLPICGKFILKDYSHRNQIEPFQTANGNSKQY